MRLQIAFDYLMVFIFVLVIFTIIFSLVSSQRVIFFNQEVFGQLQVVAQTVSGEILAAEQAGNGYNATLTLPSGLSVLHYSIAVTRYGAVVVTSNNLGEHVQAVASSAAYNLLSNSSYLSQNNQYYNLPTFNGSGFLTIQNSYGTVCIDLQCPSPSVAPLELSIYPENTHAITLSGSGSYLSNAQVAPINNQQAWTLSAWIYPQDTLDIYTEGIPQETLSLNINPNGAINLGSWNAGYAGNWYYSNTMAGAITFNSWNFIAVTLSGGGVGTGTVSFYVNGKLVSSTTGQEESNAGGHYLALGTNIGSLYGGGQPTSQFAGSISNFQIYNALLSPQQVNSIYYSGIAGSPILPSNIIAWWPLNGNAQDLGGSRYNLTVSGTSSYPAVSELIAKALTGGLTPANNALVGFTSSIGNFTKGLSAHNFTNINGNAISLLSQGSSQGLALVKAYVSTSPVSNANTVAWWPLSEGQGGIIDDVGGQVTGPSHLTGNIVLASWPDPNYVAGFDGSSAYVQLPDNSSTQSLSLVSPITVSGWIYVNGYTNGYWDLPFAKQGAFEAGVCGTSLYVCYYDWGGTGEHDSSVQLTPNTWYLFTAVMQGGRETIYVNGVQVLTGSLTPSTEIYGMQLGYGGCCNEFFYGQESNVQMYGLALSEQQILSLYQQGIGAAPISTSKLLGWWPLFGDAADYSGNRLKGTIYGNLQMNPYAQNQKGASYLLSGSFDGASSLVNITSTPQIATGNFSASAWVNYNGPTANCQGIFGDWSGSSTNNGFELFAEGVPGCPALQVDSQTVGWPAGSGSQLPANSWIFVTATYNAGTGNAIVYVNGVPFSSALLSTNMPTTRNSPYNIGNSPSSATRYAFNGSIADVQLYNTTLSQQQVLQLYAQGISAYPLQSAGSMGWYPLNGDSKDYSKYSSNGNAISVSYYPSGIGYPGTTPSLSGYGLYFNGGSSNVLISNSIVYGNMITVSAWAYPFSFKNSASGRMTIVGQKNAYFMSINSLGKDEADFYAMIGSTLLNVTTPYPLTTGEWYMLTGEYNGANLSLYVDGSEVNSIATSGSIVDSLSPTVIGSFQESPYTSRYFNGSIADIMLYNSSLSRQQIAQLYSSGVPESSSTTVPLGVLP